MPFYNVTVTIKADTDMDAEAAVERGLDKQGFVTLDICADRLKDQDIIDQLVEQEDQ
jgi:hypothetical protein